MTLAIYENRSDERKMNKDIIQIATYEGTLRDESSITNPTILMEGQYTINAQNTNMNYMYLPDFRRYYYITDIIQKRANIYEIRARVDVLMSFKNEIGDCLGIMAKNKDRWNLYLDDGSLKVYQNKTLKTVEFPSGFNTAQMVLTMAG